jgi:3-oxoacyl-[acyl-carrier protein] reductase
MNDLRSRAHEGLSAGQVALVTGAARGVGEAVAIALAVDGASIAVLDRDAAALDGVVKRIGPSSLALTADLADVDRCEEAVAATVARFGRLDILVNNAAILTRTPLEKLTVSQFDLIIAVNLRAPLFLARAAMRAMRANPGGRIVNVASIAARTGGFGDVHAYAASKGGLVTLTRSLARDGARDGILVNAVLPANVDTPMVRDAFPESERERIASASPLGRMSTPQEIASLVVWLCQPGSSYVTGAAFDVNGGIMMA